jgi:sortase A
MLGKRNLDNLSVEELEKALRVKKRQARMDRFQQMSVAGYTTNEALTQETPVSVQPVSVVNGNASTLVDDDSSRQRSRSKKMTDGLLLGLEVTAVIGLVVVLGISYFNLRELNDEVSEAQHQAVITPSPGPTPNSKPPIALSQLPGGHSPPTSPGGAVPDVPPHLQQWVQPTTVSALSLSIEMDEQRGNAPSRIVIPKLNVDAPIVNDVSWEALKKGVGHLPGSAYPGERGNLYLAAHNDIYGEIFRYLNELEPGDEYFIYGGEQKFRYVVKEKRIIEPDDVEVMWPTTEPVATLQTCYPYLIDTHRLVIIGELAE